MDIPEKHAPSFAGLINYTMNIHRFSVPNNIEKKVNMDSLLYNEQQI